MTRTVEASSGVSYFAAYLFFISWLAVFSTRICANEAALAPIVLESIPKAQRQEKISALAQEIRARKQNDPTWSPSKQWTLLLGQLAESPKNSPELVTPSIMLFGAIAEPAEPCLNFCRALLTDPGSRHHDEALLLLKSVRGQDRRCKEVALQFIAKGQSAESSVAYLVEVYGSDPEAISGLLRASQSGGEASLGVMNALLGMHLSKEHAAACLDTLVPILEKQEIADADRQILRTLVTGIQRNPRPFRRCLDAKRISRWIPFLAAQDAERRHSSALILALSSSEFSHDLLAGFLKAYSNALPTPQPAEIGLGCVLGYWPAGSLDASARAVLAELESKMSGLAATGVYSLFLRGASRSDIQLTQDHLARLDPFYLRGFVGKSGKLSLPPAQWRIRWEKDPPSLRHHFLPSLEDYPDAPEACWLVEQSIDDARLSAALLNSLWRIRAHENSALKSSPKLKEWLKLAAKDAKNTHAAATAAGLVFFIYEDAPEASSLAIQIAKAQTNTTGQWNRLVEVLLSVTPADTPVLEEFRSKLQAVPSNGKTRPGTEWFLWLLDLRRGKPVAAPPIESLADALKHLSVIESPWLDSVLAANQKLYPWLDSFRDPYIFLAGSSNTPKYVMELLGIIDRLELAKRRVAGK